MNVSVIVPLMNEEEAFTRTVETLLGAGDADILEILVVVCDRTGPASLARARRARDDTPGVVRIVEQTLPHLGGALRTGMAEARGTHVLTMYSDLESDPNIVPHLVEAARGCPDAVVSASRWRKTSQFLGYGSKKKVVNWLFQKGCSILFLAPVTDFTFGFRLYPQAYLATTRFDETAHAFVLESLLKAIRLGRRVIEVPSVFQARSEGRSQVRFSFYPRYFLVVFRTRMTLRPGRWVRPAAALD